MRAVAFSSFGGPEVLSVADIPIPEPGPTEVRIRVAAATVNPTDLGLRAGNRSEALSAFEPPYVPGMELAGTIDAAGSETHWKTGDQVMAIAMPRRTGRGAQSEFVVVPAASVAAIPTGASLIEAATVPMNGLTAQGCLDLLRFAPGKWIVVTGAAGAVGGYCVQLATLEGHRVIAVASAEDERLMREFGAEAFVERGDDIAKRIREVVPEGVDAVIDAASIGEPCFGAIRDNGKFIAVRGGFNGPTERGIETIGVGVGDYAENTAALERLGELAGNGQLTLRVAQTFAPEQAAETHRLLAAGGIRGRLVITF